MRIVDRLVRSIDGVACFAQGAILVRLEQVCFLRRVGFVVDVDSGCLSPVDDLNIFTASGIASSRRVVGVFANLAHRGACRLLSGAVVNTGSLVAALCRRCGVRVGGVLPLICDIVGVSCSVLRDLPASPGRTTGVIRRGLSGLLGDRCGDIWLIGLSAIDAVDVGNIVLGSLGDVIGAIEGTLGAGLFGSDSRAGGVGVIDMLGGGNPIV